MGSHCWLPLCKNRNKMLHLVRKETIELSKCKSLNSFFFFPVCVWTALSFMLLNDWCFLLCSTVPYYLHHSISDNQKLPSSAGLSIFKKFYQNSLLFHLENQPTRNTHTHTHSTIFCPTLNLQFSVQSFKFYCSNK